MKSKRILIFLLMIMMAFAMACSCGVLNGLLEKVGAEPAAGDGINADLGEEYRSEFGGFSFQKIPDYTFEDTMGIVQMAAPGGNLQTGPGILFTGGLNGEKITVEKAIENMKTSTPDYTFENPKDIQVGGESGKSLDFTGVYEGEDVQGRIVIVMIGDYQQFICVMLAPPDQWKDEVSLYESVLDTVKFFEPDPEALSFEEFDTEEASVQATPLPTEEPGLVEVTQYQFLRQWAVGAVASDEFGSNGWGAIQAIGEPNVDDCGDNSLAWASLSSNSYAWIELTYATPVYPSEINIYQSYNPSAVVEVDLITTTGEEYIAWTGYPEEVGSCPDKMTITLDLTEPLQVNKVRVYVDQSYFNNWTEIDAVELVGMSSTAGASDSFAPDLTALSNQKDVNFTFFYEGCETLSAGGPYIQYSQPTTDRRQLFLYSDANFVNILLPSDWLAQSEHEFTEFYAFTEEVPVMTIDYYDSDYYYGMESGYIWFENVDANHINGYGEFSGVKWLKAGWGEKVDSCTISGWFEFYNIDVTNQ